MICSICRKSDSECNCAALIDERDRYKAALELMVAMQDFDWGASAAVLLSLAENVLDGLDPHDQTQMSAHVQGRWQPLGNQPMGEGDLAP